MTKDDDLVPWQRIYRSNDYLSFVFFVSSWRQKSISHQHKERDAWGGSRWCYISFPLSTAKRRSIAQIANFSESRIKSAKAKEHKGMSLAQIIQSPTARANGEGQSHPVAKKLEKGCRLGWWGGRLVGWVYDCLVDEMIGWMFDWLMLSQQAVLPSFTS